MRILVDVSLQCTYTDRTQALSLLCNHHGTTSHHHGCSWHLSQKDDVTADTSFIHVTALDTATSLPLVSTQSLESVRPFT